RHTRSDRDWSSDVCSSDLGFSYLYGTTGAINLDVIGAKFRAAATGPLAATKLDTWQTLAVVILMAGFAFKIAAVPLHFYAGDVRSEERRVGKEWRYRGARE